MVRVTEDEHQSISDLDAAYLLPFAAFLRIGEITYNSEVPGSERLYGTRVTRRCVIFSDNNDSRMLHRKCSKTDIKNEVISIIVAAIDFPLCSVKALLCFWQ